MANKFDFKKEYKDLYFPKQRPAEIRVPKMRFLMVDGRGAPSEDAYQNALAALYALTFTIKMSKMNGKQPQRYFDYVAPPLEGLWWCEGGGLDPMQPKSEWLWTSMIRQPEFVTGEVFGWACGECRRKKPQIDLSGVRLQEFEEGLCVQMLHIGPYDDEWKAIGQMKAFMDERGLTDCSGDVRCHHEIYLSDVRRTDPQRLKTVLRLPVE